jgi:hypothetical protein
MNEAEIRIAQKLLPRDWTSLREVVLKVIAFFGGPRGSGLAMVNRYLHERVLELALVAPDGTMTEFSRMDCEHRTIHAPLLNPAEGVRVEPYEAGHYLARLAELTSPADRQLPAADGPKPSQSSQVKQQSEQQSREEGETASAEAQLQPEPQPSNSPVAEVTKLSGKQWVAATYERTPKELLAMGITGASEALAKKSETALDCAKPLTARYIEKLLRDLNTFPKAYRGSLKQRPK